jgi:dihydrofolate synthase/folylpolyglutamate synthase
MHRQSNTERLNRYRKAVSFVESFSNSSIKKEYRKSVEPKDFEKKDFNFFLNRTRYFLDLLGSPDAGFKYVHVTGTAGKGTVSTMVQEMLIADGKRTGLYTSPYVTAATEKIRVGGEYVSMEDFADIVDELKPFIKKSAASPYGSPSAFELSLVIAILYFKRMKCEWVVLEVGLGGRYDATNMIRGPKIAAVTTIDYDHTEILGNTLEKIAYDKAGIIKPQSVFFTSEQRPKLISLFKKICREQKAEFHHVGKQKDYKKYNEELARMIATKAGVSKKSIDAGIQNTRLPCRFEVIDLKPVTILDGAHNRAKIKSTIANLKELARSRNNKHGKVFVIVAISDTKKDNRAILAPIARVADHIVVTSLTIKTTLTGGGRKSVHPMALLPYLKKAIPRPRKNKVEIEVIMEPKLALKKVQDLAGEDDFILATGSFFLAGELRKCWYSEEWVLKNRKSFK